MTGIDLKWGDDLRTPPPSDWGQWRLDVERRVLTSTPPGHREFEVDLERCLDSAETLDHIMQLASKSIPIDLAGVVHAINDVLRPQANLCSFGDSKELTPADIARLVDDAADRWPHLCD